MSGAVLRAGRRLKLLHKWGVGVNSLDLDAARALGMRVARTTGSNAVLRAMRRTAVLANVARGGVVVEADLVAALRGA